MGNPALPLLLWIDHGYSIIPIPMGEEKRPSRILSFVGGVSLFVGAAYAVVKLWEALSASGSKIVIHGAYHEAAMPKSEEADLGSALADLSAYCTFDVVNTGLQEASDLVLEIPAKGYYEIERDGSDGEHGKFDSRISLGSLRSGNALHLQLWCSTIGFDVYKFAEARATWPKGAASVSAPSWSVPRLQVWSTQHPRLRKAAGFAGSMGLIISVVIILYLYSLIFEKRILQQKYDKLIEPSEKKKKK